MKWSQFNCLINDGGAYFLHNTRTLALLKLDEETYKQFTILRNDIKTAKSILGDTKYEYVVANKIIVEDDEDLNYINTLKYKKRIESFSTSVLSLVIAPTLACNFACPYCYEKDLPVNFMTEQTQENIIEFANQFVGKCTGISLCWHGGEPLLAFKVIKELYDKFEKFSKLPILDSSIVTNGYLLTPEICEFFNEKGLEYIQITLDGDKGVHDKTRVLKNGGSSFERIIHNVDMAIQYMPKTKIGIRTNIGTSNYKGYVNLYKEYSEKWKGTNAFLYDTFVSDTSRSCHGSQCIYELTTRQKNNFKIQLVEEGIIESMSLYSQLDNEFYTCGDENAFVIDPEGRLYKCWADIGLSERAIGNVVDGVVRFDTVAQYIVGSDKFSDKKCVKCKFLPVCDGGCNLMRINARKNNVPVNACPIDSRGIRQYISQIFKDKILKE